MALPGAQSHHVALLILVSICLSSSCRTCGTSFGSVQADPDLLLFTRDFVWSPFWFLYSFRISSVSRFRIRASGTASYFRVGVHANSMRRSFPLLYSCLSNGQRSFSARITDVTFKKTRCHYCSMQYSQMWPDECGLTTVKIVACNDVRIIHLHNIHTKNNYI